MLNILTASQFMPMFYNLLFGLTMHLGQPQLERNDYGIKVPYSICSKLPETPFLFYLSLPHLDQKKILKLLPAPTC